MKARKEKIRYRKQIRQIIVIAILFCIGAGVGMVIAASSANLNSAVWVELREGMTAQLGETDWKSYFAYLLMQKVKWYGLLILFSATVFALPYIAGNIIYKGISTGFFFMSLKIEFGWKGIVFGLASLFPQILILLPLTVLYLLFLLQFHREVNEYKNFTGWRQYIRQIVLFLLCIGLGCLLQAKVNLALLQSAVVLLD